MAKNAVLDSHGCHQEAFEICKIIDDGVRASRPTVMVTIGAYISFVRFCTTGVTGTFELYDKDENSAGNFSLNPNTLDVSFENIYISKILCTSSIGAGNSATIKAFGGN